MMLGGRGLALVASVIALAWAASATAAESGSSADPGFDFSGYRIPAQNWRSWFVNGTGAGYSSSVDGPGSSNQLRTATGSLTTALQSGYDSDPLYYDWALRLGGSGRGDFTKSTSSLENSNASHHQWAQFWDVSGSVRAYPWETPVGFTAGARGTGNYTQDWQRQDDEVIPLPNVHTERSNRVYDYTASGSIGVGVGRVRDAGNLYRAWLFERRLVRDGTLLRPLSPSARARLADLFTTESGYGFAHQFPDKAFWSEVEKLLHEDGVLPDSGMAAYGLMHAMDPMVGGATYDARNIGWFIGPSLSGTHKHIINDASLNGASSRAEASSDLITAGGSVEYHRPIGIAWQLDLFASASADVKGLKRGDVFLSGASVRYRFAESWLAWLQGNSERILARVDHPGDFWFVSIQSGAEYQLEDHWRLTLALRRDQEHQNDPAAGYRTLTGTLGVTWSWGRFDAPGLIAPVRPLPIGPP
jgi:hypothetical protein